jgi:aldehyde:ferredoxin oxidoreductase
MGNGYHGRILRVNLSDHSVSIEQRDESFWRTYQGGRGLIAYHLLKELQPGTDPLGPANKLIFATGSLTGTPTPGSGRNSVGAKSPLTNGYGEAEAGGFWGATFKWSGFDALIVEGRSEKPVYLWIHDGEADIRDASAAWGQTTKEAQETIRRELGEPRASATIIGPAGERLVRYACILNGLSHAAGRTGMGAVMGSKNLKAIAVQGRDKPGIADKAALQEVSRWFVEHRADMVGELSDSGTAGRLLDLQALGALPTRNFQMGLFEEAERISGQAMRDEILVGRGSCHACPVRCKRAVSMETPYRIDPAYGGPEYESMAALGSNCGIGDLAAVAKGNELCNAYGLDTISTGSCISFAMECFERGVLGSRDTGGLQLNFGNAESMLQLIHLIGRREGLGDLLAQGVRQAAETLGPETLEFAMHVKGQDLPMHDPRLNPAVGLGYAVSPTGADHLQSIHDIEYVKEGPPVRQARALGLLDPLPVHDLGPAKVRLFCYMQHWNSLKNCLLLCVFVPYSFRQVVDIVNAVTGWNSTVWELMKCGERATTMARLFNVREGLGVADDDLPSRFMGPVSSGPLANSAVDHGTLRQALATYYTMMGWDPLSGTPVAAKLQELGIGWAVDQLTAAGRRC